MCDMVRFPYVAIGLVRNVSHGMISVCLVFTRNHPVSLGNCRAFVYCIASMFLHV